MSLRRRVAPPAPPLSDYSMRELLSFLSSWSPRRVGWGRWTTWTAYLTDYARVRPELYRRFRTGRRKGVPAPFGDRALAFRDRHGLNALEAASSADIKAHG